MGRSAFSPPHDGTWNNFACPWIACSVTLPREVGDAEAHCDQHAKEILEQWSSASKCPWPTCRSKATFKTRSSLRTHLSNVHVTPLICDAPLCLYKKPFGKKYELDRHMLTAHGANGETSIYKCTIETCEASITRFARRDKLLKHLREERENLKCPFAHCVAIVLATKEEEHIQKFHGSYECAMTGCENSGSSRFLEVNLKRHLRRDHRLTFNPVQRLIAFLRRTGNNTP
jgi:hypothetical protein